MRPAIKALGILILPFAFFAGAQSLATVYTKSACLTMPVGAPGRVSDCKATWTTCHTGGSSSSCMVGGTPVFPFSWDTYTEFPYKYCGTTDVYTKCDNDTGTWTVCRTRSAYLDNFCADFACTLYMQANDCKTLW